MCCADVPWEPPCEPPCEVPCEVLWDVVWEKGCPAEFRLCDEWRLMSTGVRQVPCTQTSEFTCQNWGRKCPTLGQELLASQGRSTA
jgi:hypothetical protein